MAHNNQTQFPAVTPAGGATGSSRFWCGMAALFERQVTDYTMGESSSVPTETAEELLKSLSFAIGTTFDAASAAQCMEREGEDAVFAAAQRSLRLRISKAKILLREARKTALPLENESYQSTLAEIGLFFRRYDPRFFSHDVPSSIEYQLSRPVPESVLGIDYVSEYLRRLILENRFCSLFCQQLVRHVLECSSPDYKGLLLNLFEPIAVNALGCALCGKDPAALCITSGERAALSSRLLRHTETEMSEELQCAAKTVCNSLGVSSPALRDYIEKTSSALVPRLGAAVCADNLCHVFVSPAKEFAPGWS